MPKFLHLSLIILGLLCSFTATGVRADGTVSEETAECLECHSSLHPGIVKDWQNSRHAAITPGDALKVKGNARKISSPTVPENLRGKAVGCAECHTLRPGEHADTFEHNGYDIHVVVSPPDCATCHREETTQYADNLMSRAYGNLADNPVYRKLQVSIIGQTTRKGQNIHEPLFREIIMCARVFHLAHNGNPLAKGFLNEYTDVGILNIALPVQMFGFLFSFPRC